MRFFNKDAQNNNITYMSFTRKELKIIILWAFLSLPAWLLLYYSVDFLPVGLAETLQNLTPFITLLIGYYWLNEKMKSLEIVNMLISFGGVLFIVSLRENQNDGTAIVQASAFVYLMGVLANSVSAAIFAVNNIIIRVLKHLDTIAFSAFHATISFLINLLVWLAYRTIINPNGFVFNFTLQ